MSSARKRQSRAPQTRRASSVFVVWSGTDSGRLRAEVVDRKTRDVLVTLRGSQKWIDGFLSGFLAACDEVAE